MEKGVSWTASFMLCLVESHSYLKECWPTSADKHYECKQ